MSQVLSPESPLPPPPGRRRSLEGERVDRDAVIAAIVAVLLIHLMVIWMAPRQAPMPESVEMPEREQILVELLPPPEVEEEPAFVRANPTAPEEEPVDTTNYSNRSQVSAQEEAALPSEENVPLIEGDREESNRIVQGDPFQQPPMPSAAAQDAQAQSPAVQQQPAPDQQPEETLPDVREAEPETEEGIVSLENPDDNLEEPEEVAEELNPIEERSPLDGTGQAQNLTPPQQQGKEAREPRPDRPTLQDNSYGPILKTFTGVSRTGRTAIDARYSEFGVYWNRVLEIIELKWNQLVSNSYRSIQFSGQQVVVEFVIDRKGAVTEVRVVESAVGRLAEVLAVDSIQSPAPFPEWTPEMISTMGAATPKRITFIY